MKRLVIRALALGLAAVGIAALVQASAQAQERNVVASSPASAPAPSPGQALCCGRDCDLKDALKALQMAVEKLPSDPCLDVDKSGAVDSHDAWLILNAKAQEAVGGQRAEAQPAKATPAPAPPVPPTPPVQTAAAPEPEAKPKARPTWTRETIYHSPVQAEVPRGAGWYEAFGHFSIHRLDEPEALFAVRVGEKNLGPLLQTSRAVASGQAQLAGRTVVVHQGQDPNFGPITLMVFKDLLYQDPNFKNEKHQVGVIFGGRQQELHREELERIKNSLRLLDDGLIPVADAKTAAAGDSVKAAAQPVKPQPATQAGAAPAGGREIYRVWDLGGCSLTDQSVFVLDRKQTVSKLEIWYLWKAAETEAAYVLLSGGRQILADRFRRGQCASGASGWCLGVSAPNLQLEPGQYTVKLTSGAKICQNAATKGRGYVVVYAP